MQSRYAHESASCCFVTTMLLVEYPLPLAGGVRQLCLLPAASIHPSIDLHHGLRLLFLGGGCKSPFATIEFVFRVRGKMCFILTFS